MGCHLIGHDSTSLRHFALLIFIAVPLDLLVQKGYMGVIGSDLVPLLDKAERVKGETWCVVCYLALWDVPS